MKLKNEKGFSLTELIVVMLIMGVLMAIAGLSAHTMLERYAIEGQIREMYADLMNVRARAMQRNRTHFVSLAAASYIVYEDTNPSPDGNETLETDSDRIAVQKQLKKTMTVPNPILTFDSRGLTSDNQMVCIFSNVNPVFDCMNISATRINIGKILVQADSGGTCVSTNCVAK